MTEPQEKSVKVDLEDHKWLMKKKVDLGYKSIGDVIHILIVREQNLEADKRGSAGKRNTPGR